MPGALLPDDAVTPAPGDFYSAEELEVFRLSSKSHWDLPLLIQDRTVRPGGPEQAALQGGANATHLGPPAHDTADFAEPPGNLRADDVLPSADLPPELAGTARGSASRRRAIVAGGSPGRWGQGGDMLNPGDTAPDFVGRDHTGQTVKLADLLGKTVVLWFFPKADTPG
jgi:hypothetical protein